MKSIALPCCIRTYALAGIIALACSVAACDNSSTAPSPTGPPAPSPTGGPPVNTWTLSGTVTSSTGGSITSASVAIVDGPDAARTTTTDAAGRYSFAGLQQAALTLSAAAPGFTPLAKHVTLTANTIVDFQLQ